MARISNTSDQPASLPQSRPASGQSVFIAEDDPFISRMYETKLKSAGFTVGLANNGRDAYESIKATKPNLLLIDINMPELSGFEVLRALKNDGMNFAKVPVLVLTNSSSEADMKTAKSFGAEYIIKAELTPRAVLELIQARLGLSPGVEQ